MQLSGLEQKRLKLSLRVLTMEEWEFFDFSDETFITLGLDPSKFNDMDMQSISEIEIHCTDFIYECIIKASQKE